MEPGLCETRANPTSGLLGHQPNKPDMPGQPPGRRGDNVSDSALYDVMDSPKSPDDIKIDLGG